MNDVRKSCGLQHQAGADTARTGANPPDGPVLANMPHRLQIRLPDSLGLVIGMAHVVAHLRGLSTKVTFSAHGRIFLRFLLLRRQQPPCRLGQSDLRKHEPIILHSYGISERTRLESRREGASCRLEPPESERNVLLAQAWRTGKLFSGVVDRLPGEALCHYRSSIMARSRFLSSREIGMSR